MLLVMSLSFLLKNEDETQVRKKAEEVCQKIRKIYIEDFEGSISCSRGITFYQEHGTIFKTLYNLVNQALYQTKDRGCNGYTCL